MAAFKDPEVMSALQDGTSFTQLLLNICMASCSLLHHLAALAILFKSHNVFLAIAIFPEWRILILRSSNFFY